MLLKTRLNIKLVKSNFLLFQKKSKQRIFMVTVKTAKEVRKSFVQWNGWGPPTSEYQIGEYCRAKTASEEDSDYEFLILREWLHEAK